MLVHPSALQELPSKSSTLLLMLAKHISLKSGKPVPLLVPITSPLRQMISARFLPHLKSSPLGLLLDLVLLQGKLNSQAMQICSRTVIRTPRVILPSCKSCKPQHRVAHCFLACLFPLITELVGLPLPKREPWSNLKLIIPLPPTCLSGLRAPPVVLVLTTSPLGLLSMMWATP